LLLRRLFGAVPPSTEATDHAPLNGGAEAEYERLVTTTLRRWGVDQDFARVEILRIGETPDGRDTFIAAVKLLQWNRRPGLRLLLGLPMLERKLRKAVRAHWVNDVTHFAGVWLQAGGALDDFSAVSELRQLIVALEGPHSGAPPQTTSRPGRL
jgi:hypothetical protein